MMQFYRQEIDSDRAGDPPHAVQLPSLTGVKPETSRSRSGYIRIERSYPAY